MKRMVNVLFAGVLAMTVLSLSLIHISVHVLTTGPVTKRTLWAYRALRWFPGILIFPVLFSGLVYLCLLYTSRCV